jgi:catechol 2,3-dioxygenase-like lactoylglutathione lyase family enzyme
MFKNLMYVTVHVSDQDRALAFYTEALGLEKRVDSGICMRMGV